jgi:signal transduction histidine kinase/CheY-like chemotaxis protein
MKIRTRAYLLGFLPALLVAGVLGTYLSLSRLADIQAGIQARGHTMAHNLALASEYGVVTGNRVALEAMLGRAMTEPDVVYVGVSRVGGLLASAGDWPGEKPPGPGQPMRETARHFHFVAPVELLPAAEPDAFSEEPPATARAAPVAWVHVAMSRAGYERAARETLVAGAGISLVGLVFTMLLVRVLALSGIRPLMDTIDAVRRIDRGDLGVPLPVTAHSELSELQRMVDQMRRSLVGYQHDMQARIDAATAELARQKRAAEQANLDKSRFLAVASHDLRQPMHAIGLYVETLKPELSGRRAGDTLHKIERAVVGMQDMFTALLDVTRLDAGSIEARLGPVEVRPILERLRDSFQPEAEARGLTLRVHAPDGIAPPRLGLTAEPAPAGPSQSRGGPAIDLSVTSDALLLERILRNLVANALRYTERGGVLLAARRWRDGVRFQVFDTGVGIAADELPNIFREYYQVGDATRHAQGLGLGLAIVDRLARLLGHPLAVRSVVGRGTAFTLRVPLAEAPGERQIAALPGVAQLSGNALLVDDDASVLDSLALLIGQWGMAVRTARSFAQAMAMLDEPGPPPDIMLTDYALDAGHTGMELVAALRARHGAHAPAVLMTGETSQAAVRAIEASAIPVLFKPVQPARLRAVLTRLLRAAPPY